MSEPDNERELDDGGDDDEIDSDDLEITMTGVWVNRRDHVIVSAIVDQYAEQQRRHALIFHWLGDEWAQQLLDDSVCAACSVGGDPVDVFSIGVNGNVTRARMGDDEYLEKVDDSDRGPNYSEMLRCATVIGDRVLVAGMARQVYERDAAGTWRAIDSGVYLPRGRRSHAVGFLDIAGGEGSSIYAVGYKGEIWSTTDGRKWVQETSPTNIALTRLLRMPDGQMLAAGLAGTLLVGSSGVWRTIDHEATDDDFWGAAYFAGHAYLSTNRSLYRLEGERLNPVAFDVSGIFTTAYLHAGDGVMWSVGPKHALATADGLHWDVVPSP